MIRTSHKRVLFIVPLPPPMHGSAAVSEHIRKSRLINDSFDCDFVNISTSRSVDEIGKITIRKAFRHVETFFSLLKKLVQGRYDACCLATTCHGKGFLKDFPFILMCKAFCKKVIIHQHNKGMSHDMDRVPYRWMIPLAYEGTSVILLSERLFPDISRAVSKKDSFICPNGIDGSVLESGQRHDDMVSVLFLSNLIISKGILVLLDALKLIAEKGIAFHCDIAGNPSKELTEEGLLRKINELGLSDHVTYHGAVSGDAKEDLFRRADIFAFPTFYENECFPLVILEAMSHSIPVVTTDEGGIPDMIHDGVEGLICTRKDKATLAGCIQQLIENPDMRVSMGGSGRKAFESDYTTEAFERRFCGILNKVFNN